MSVRFSLSRDGIIMSVRFSLSRDGIIMFVRFSLSRDALQTEPNRHDNTIPRQTETNDIIIPPLDKLNRTNLIIPSLNKLNGMYYYFCSLQFF
jgi:hypothetical protein